MPHLYIVDLVHTEDMNESYGNYVDDEYFDNHDYDDTEDDTDDDTDDDNDHKKDSYTAAGAVPDAGAALGPGLRKLHNPNKTETQTRIFRARGWGGPPPLRSASK